MGRMEKTIKGLIKNTYQALVGRKRGKAKKVKAKRLPKNQSAILVCSSNLKLLNENSTNSNI